MQKQILRATSKYQLLRSQQEQRVIETKSGISAAASSCSLSKSKCTTDHIIVADDPDDNSIVIISQKGSLLALTEHGDWKEYWERTNEIRDVATKQNKNQ
eukprot:4833816-Ditylum_brightwellii.AAC.1